MIGKVKAFIAGVKQELKKVSWSTRDELMGSTTVVIISTALLALFIGLCDFVLSTAVNMVLR